MSPELHLPPLGRRAFLRRAGLAGGLGALALGAPSLLAACGSSSSDDAEGDRLTLTTELEGRQLVGLFNYTGGYVEAGAPQRLVLTIGSADGPPERDGPPTLTVQLAHDGTDVGDPITIDRHADGVPIGFYPLTTTFERDGIWTVSTELDGRVVGQDFQVEASGQSPIPQIGASMIPVETPTDADARGVNPMCTRSPQCPFHGQTLTQALATGAPVALMISTPQYCQIGVCGPVLDLVMEQAAVSPTVQVVHAEVYVDPAAGADPAAAGLTRAVSDYGLSFEPSLFVARADGTIVSRLDNVFDRTELAQAFQLATA
jgi:hypothetical protein